MLAIKLNLEYVIKRMPLFERLPATQKIRSPLKFTKILDYLKSKTFLAENKLQNRKNRNYNTETTVSVPKVA